MNDLLLNLALGKKVEEKDIENALAEVCDTVHSGCDGGCPVYAMNFHSVPYENIGNGRAECACFKDGKKMLAFLRSHGK